MPVQNFRDVVGKALADSKKAVSEALQRRMGPPPVAVAARAQKDDEYRAFWRLGDGWPQDEASQQARVQAMYAAGAKPADVLKVMYPDRVQLLVLGDRRDNLAAQVEFSDQMVARHMETLAGVATELRDSMTQEGGQGA